jgi:phenylalanyl-tRNA synthetase beta chain
VGALTAADPLAREESVLRRSLRPGLLRAVGFNLDRRVERAWLFDVGNVFEPSDGTREAPRVDAERWLPHEREVLSIDLAGGGADATTAAHAWNVLADALRLEAPTLTASEAEPGLHPTRTATIAAADGTRLGVVGEVDPDVLAGLGIAVRVAVLEVDLAALLLAPRRSDEARAVSRFPSSDVDLAFTVADEVTAAAVEAAIRRGGGDLVEWVRLFDVYRGQGVPAGARSLAFRVRLSALDRTLGEAEVSAARQACIDAAAALGAQLR